MAHHAYKSNVVKKGDVDPSKVKTAVALTYEPGSAAPTILATGKGHLAERIVEQGLKSDVPFYKDNKLADTLSRLEIGDAIPPELYEVVAEILVFVDSMDKLRGKLGM
ncbi:MAG: EscU/YscU/HrcU family type III secretion system export apparatus switch protein [Eubacterium sp.]|nr:EscU/YscU/HrcU family type III secretion system export apparatus switch protein [Eubacterium sp.]